jgi:hypothetical protein
MKRVLALMLLLAVAVPLVLRAETWKNVTLMDFACAGKASVKANPDSHTTKCLLNCQPSGYGILTQDGAFLAFDEAGNTKVEEALKETKKTDHLRVSVEGEKNGNDILVNSISLD